jgi:hypothetical protein
MTKVVSISPCATVEVDDGVVLLGNIEGVITI